MPSRHSDAADLARTAPGDLALLTIGGSHAYGTSTPDSDHDYRGVFIAPLKQVLSLNAPAKTFDRAEPDVTLHELSHFAKLAAAANPTVLEVLWTERLHTTIHGGRLVARRHLFMSRQVVRTYGGYAVQQLRKAQAGSGDSKRGHGHHKRDKFFLHTLRLLEQGTHCLRTGELQVRVEDPDALWERARRPVEAIEREATAMLATMDEAAATSPLPEYPDYEGINALLYEIRTEDVR